MVGPYKDFLDTDREPLRLIIEHALVDRLTLNGIQELNLILPHELFISAQMIEYLMMPLAMYTSIVTRSNRNNAS